VEVLEQVELEVEELRVFLQQVQQVQLTQVEEVEEQVDLQVV